MGRKLKLVIMFSCLLLTMCKSYVGDTTYENGLACHNYVDIRFFEWRGEEYKYYVREEGADCSHVCPDGSVKSAAISGTISDLYAASEADLDSRFCSVPFQPTPTEPLATVSPTSVPSATPTLTPTVEALATTDLSSTVQASPTAQSSLLTGRVTMCDTGGGLISFRIMQPPPDLTGQTVTAQIAGQENACYVNQTNPSLMTCTLPAGVTFPARIVVSVDGAVVNDFTFDGIGCGDLTTPVPTTTP